MAVNGASNRAAIPTARLDNFMASKSEILCAFAPRRGDWGHRKPGTADRVLGFYVSMPKIQLNPVEFVLLLTAFSAGTVDVISFASLGGVFASAMTGNFALLAYYIAQRDSLAAMGSIVALSGFVLGCAFGVWQRRGRTQHQALTLLLITEAALLLFFALSSLMTPRVPHAPSDHLHILLLAVAMGFQAVI